MLKSIKTEEGLQKLQKLAASRGLQVQYRNSEGKVVPIRILNSSKKVVATGTLEKAGSGISVNDLNQTAKELRGLNASLDSNDMTREEIEEESLSDWPDPVGEVWVAFDPDDPEYGPVTAVFSSEAEGIEAGFTEGMMGYLFSPLNSDTAVVLQYSGDVFGVYNNRDEAADAAVKAVMYHYDIGDYYTNYQRGEVQDLINQIYSQDSVHDWEITIVPNYVK